MQKLESMTGRGARFVTRVIIVAFVGLGVAGADAYSKKPPQPIRNVGFLPTASFEFLPTASLVFALPKEDNEAVSEQDIAVAFGQWHRGLDAFTPIHPRGKVMEGSRGVKFYKKVD